MRPEDVNRLNAQPRNIKKLQKYCSKCNAVMLVSDYISKCPTCHTFLEGISQAQANIPTCPTCHSTNIQNISLLSRATHGAMFGLLSKTARSQFECKNCGYKW